MTKSVGEVIMFIIGTTKIVQKELNLKIEPYFPKKVEPLFEWHMHLFKLGRLRCLILMNDLTRYSMIIVGIKKKQLADLNNLLLQTITENLKAEGTPENFLEHFRENGKEIIFTNSHDRSVLGTMNETIFFTMCHFEKTIKTEDINALEINRENNRISFKPLGYLYPIEALKNEIEKKIK